SAVGTTFAVSRLALPSRLVAALPSLPKRSTPNGIRTRVAGVKGRCPGPLDDGGPGQRTARPKAYPPARIDASDVCVDAAYATPPLRSDAAPTTTGRPPRDGPWGRGCAEPGCASQPQPGRPWFDGVMIRISREDFEEAVDDALDSLPEEIARAIAEANVAILVEEEPAPEQSGGTELLGLYEGIPLDKRSIFQGYAQPDRIFIFRGPLQRHARSREHLVEEIAVTVLHELGHLFGISDARLHELGWG